MAKANSAVPTGYHTVTPQLTLDNAAQAIEWYKKTSRRRNWRSGRRSG